MKGPWSHPVTLSCVQVLLFLQKGCGSVVAWRFPAQVEASKFIRPLSHMSVSLISVSDVPGDVFFQILRVLLGESAISFVVRVALHGPNKGRKKSNRAKNAPFRVLNEQIMQTRELNTQNRPNSNRKRKTRDTISCTFLKRVYASSL